MNGSDDGASKHKHKFELQTLFWFSKISGSLNFESEIFFSDLEMFRRRLHPRKRKKGFRSKNSQAKEEIKSENLPPLLETHFSELPDLHKIKNYTNPT